ncbi:hypothetical protein [Thioalkalivibrio sp. ALE19]|uniref:hypothetical protein n=1 Tax=Thioalkalivibrio sp. ALE19 TaxID=1266909 RepID=UPI000407FCB0|nr:hypothetical protein [Thioalkalivibrio sp. ALE19]
MDANWNNRHERARTLLQYVAEAGASEKGDHALQELRRYIDSMEAVENELTTAYMAGFEDGKDSAIEGQTSSAKMSDNAGVKETK